MNYHLEMLPDEPILVAHLTHSFSISADLTNLMSEVAQVLETVGQPVFYVVDMVNVKMNFEDVVSASSMAARGAGTFLHDPNIRESIFITGERIIQVSLQGLRAPVFGLQNVHAFPTLDEALAHCRQHMSV